MSGKPTTPLFTESAETITFTVGPRSWTLIPATKLPWPGLQFWEGCYIDGDRVYFTPDAREDEIGYALAQLVDVGIGAAVEAAESPMPQAPPRTLYRVFEIVDGEAHPRAPRLSNETPIVPDGVQFLCPEQMAHRFGGSIDQYRWWWYGQMVGQHDDHDDRQLCEEDRKQYGDGHPIIGGPA